MAAVSAAIENAGVLNGLFMVGCPIKVKNQANQANQADWRIKMPSDAS